jgi:DNA-binding NarL/FixJ family response regulator
MTTLFSIDDHPIAVEGLKRVIEKIDGATLIGFSYNPIEAIEQIVGQNPDIVIFDYELPSMTGLELIEKIRNFAPSIKSICYTMHSDVWLQRKLCSLGVNGYVNKSEHPDSITIAIKSIIHGRDYYPDIDTLKTGTRTNNCPESFITKKELEVLSLIVQGNTTKEIGSILHLSINTIETYRKKLLIKLKVKNTAELTAKAIILGLV